MKRRKSKKIFVGKSTIGGDSPIRVQSMANIKTSRVSAVSKQINSLTAAGCDIIRVSILDEKDAQSLKSIKKNITIPLVADIHFNHRLALSAIQNGADKIRINPGNISQKNDLREIVAAAKDAGIPIRFGANSGSVDKVTHKAKSAGVVLAKSILSSLRYIESLKFTNIVLSAKGHGVNDTMEAYRILADKTAYPLHVGITASGAGEYAVIKSAVGIGGLLSQGIGDTIRVSLTDAPVHEVRVGCEILQSLRLRERPWEVIACPTCGRTEIGVITLAKKVEHLLATGAMHVPRSPFKIAVMGCVVNGPGESKDADIGISGGRGFGFIFAHGKMVKKVDEKDLLDELIKQCHTMK